MGHDPPDPNDIGVAVEQAARTLKDRLPQLHRHPRDLHAASRDSRTTGQRIADQVAATMGSWPFILIQTGIVLCWMLYNGAVAVTWLRSGAFDPYPFILLNLAFSTQAAYAAPFIMMSQNRQGQVDRAHAENAYEHINEVNAKQDAQIAILREQNDRAVEQHRQMLDLLTPLLADRAGPGTVAPSHHGTGQP